MLGFRSSIVLTLAFAVCFSSLLSAAEPARNAPIKPSPPQPSTENLTEHLDIVYASHGEREMHLDLIVPKKFTPPLPAIMLIHGGGWLKGDKSKFRPMGRALASRGYAVAVVEYRLGGEAIFPAAICDCNAATRWIRANGKKHGIDTTQIVAVGGSAGGHLAGLMATAPDVKVFQQGGEHQDTSSTLQAAVVLAGPLQLSTGSVADKSRNAPDTSNANKWLGKTIDEAPELYKLASPYQHISKTSPPMLFMTGEYDNPSRNSDTRSQLSKLGIETGIRVYAHGKHGCWNREPWFTPMVVDIDAFFRSVIDVGRAEPTLLAKTTWGEWRVANDRVVAVMETLPDKHELLLPRLNNPTETASAKFAHKVADVPIKPLVDGWLFQLTKSFEYKKGLELEFKTIGRAWLPVIPEIVSPAPNGQIILPAHTAETFGKLLRYEPQPHKNTVGYWANQDDWCQWRFYVESPGKYDLSVQQGCGKGNGGSKVQFAVGDQKHDYLVKETGHFQNFEMRPVGRFEFESAGVYELQVRAIKKAANAVMDIRSAVLAPVASE